ncbi:MAG: hypothetical protein GC191_03490 [Azospirillum sp.]|nr:hypothetical protein [Azospirillum sp.]
MKRIIFLLIGLILMGGAGFGAWLAYQTYAPMLFGTKEEPKEEKPPPQKPPKFVRMQPITVPVIGPDRVRQFVTFQIALEVEDEAVAVALQPQMPRLIDAYITTLYAGLDDGSILKRGLIDVGAVKVRLVRASAKVLGEKLVLDALVQMVIQRDL